MTDADRLAHNARVPADLAAMVVMAANRLQVAVRDLRGPSQLREYMVERRRVISDARGRGYSYPVIGRALNRDHSSIIKAEQRQGRAL